jgi:hypothetical protein
MNSRTAWLGLFAAVLPLVGGCGPNLQKAGGTVSVDGKPVTCTGTIMFCPVAGGRPANGVLAEDGSFTLSYEKEGDGLPPGEYKVVIVADIWKPAATKSQAQLNEEAMAKKSGAIDDGNTTANAGGTLTHVVPPEFNDVSTTPWKETVAASGGPQQFKIDIQTKKK